MSIYKKLLKIQSQVNGLGKDSSSGSQYKYVSGAKVLEFIRPLMNDAGLLLKQEIISIENVRQDYTVNSKKWEDQGGKNVQVEFQKPKSEILSKVMMRFTWIDSETGETDMNEFGANGQNDWEKGLGSALTYAERYFLLKYFHIPTDEDDIDNELRKKMNVEKPTPAQKATTPPVQNSPAPAPASTAKTIWLNENDANWKKIEGWIAKGKTPSIAQIKETLNIGISKATAELLKTKFNIQ